MAGRISGKMKRDEENVGLEPDGWCGTPPRCMPDIFHNEPEPRTWTHVCITLVGIAAYTYMVGVTPGPYIDDEHEIIPYERTWVEVFQAWGGAYGFIFGFCPMALSVVEKAGWFCFWRVWA